VDARRRPANTRLAGKKVLLKKGRDIGYYTVRKRVTVFRKGTKR